MTRLNTGLIYCTAIRVYQAVLQLAAEKIGWGQALPANSGMGIAVVASFGSIVAQAGAGSHFRRQAACGKSGGCS